LLYYGAPIDFLGGSDEPFIENHIEIPGYGIACIDLMPPER